MHDEQEKKNPFAKNNFRVILLLLRLFIPTASFRMKQTCDQLNEKKNGLYKR